MRNALLVAALVACGSTPAHPTEPAPKPNPSGPLELTFQTLVQASGGERGVPMGTTLRTGDRIALSVSVTQPAYIYVLQFFPEGSAAVLFPSKSGEERPYSGAQRIPETGWFELDDRLGEEHLYVVASSEPLAKVDAMVMKTVDTVRTSGQLPVMTSPNPTNPNPSPNPNPKPTGTPKPNTNIAVGSSNTAPGGASLRDRGFRRVEADKIHASADNQGVAVFRFWFKHEAR